MSDIVSWRDILTHSIQSAGLPVSAQSNYVILDTQGNVLAQQSTSTSRQRNHEHSHRLSMDRYLQSDTITTKNRLLTDPLLLALGFQNVENFSDTELYDKLQPISNVWMFTDNINLDLARPFLDALDNVLRRYVHYNHCKTADDIEYSKVRYRAKKQLQAAYDKLKQQKQQKADGTLDINEQYKLQYEPDTAINIDDMPAEEPVPAGGAPSRELVLCILRFHVLMLSHCTHADIYESTDNIVYMLNSDDLTIMSGALHVLLALQINSQTKHMLTYQFAARYEVKIRDKLLWLTCKLRLPGINKLDGTNGTNTIQTMLQSHSKQTIDQVVNSLALPVTSKTQSATDFNNKITYQHIAPHITPSMTTHDIVTTIQSQYTVRTEDLCDLYQSIRYIRNAYNQQSRKQYVFIRFAALQLILSFSSQRKETLATLSISDAEFLDSLLDVLRSNNDFNNDELIEIKTACMSVLTSLLVSQSVRQQFKAIGALQTGVVLYMLRQAIDNVKHTPDRNSEQSVIQLYCDKARYAASLTHLLEKLVPKTAYESLGLSILEILDSIIELMSDQTITSMSVLGNSINIIEELIHHHSTTALTKFHSLNGLDACFDRLVPIVHTLAQHNNIQLIPLTTVSPAVDFQPTQTAKSLITTPFWCCRSLLNGLLGVMASVTKRHRQPIKMSSLRNGQFVEIVKLLWQQSLRDTSTTQQYKHPYENVLQQPNNNGRWGETTWSLTCGLVCAVIQNQPALLKELIDGNIAHAFLSQLNTNMLKNAYVLKCVPETIRSLCLNSAGLEAVKQHNPIKLLLSLFVQNDDATMKLLDRGMLTLLGRAIDELFRHYPDFVSMGMQAIIDTINQLAVIAGQIDAQSQTPTIDTVKQYDLQLDRFSRFLELIIRQLFDHSTNYSAFRNAGGVDALLYLIRKRLESQRLWALDTVPNTPSNDKLTELRAEYNNDDTKIQQALHEQYVNDQITVVAFTSLITPLTAATGTTDQAKLVVPQILSILQSSITACLQYNDINQLIYPFKTLQSTQHNIQYIRSGLCAYSQLAWSLHAVSRLVKRVPIEMLVAEDSVIWTVLKQLPEILRTAVALASHVEYVREANRLQLKAQQSDKDKDTPISTAENDRHIENDKLALRTYYTVLTRIKYATSGKLIATLLTYAKKATGSKHQKSTNDASQRIYNYVGACITQCVQPYQFNANVLQVDNNTVELLNETVTRHMIDFCLIHIFKQTGVKFNVSSISTTEYQGYHRGLIIAFKQNGGIKYIQQLLQSTIARRIATNNVTIAPHKSSVQHSVVIDRNVSTDILLQQLANFISCLVTIECKSVVRAEYDSSEKQHVFKSTYTTSNNTVENERTSHSLIQLYWHNGGTYIDKLPLQFTALMLDTTKRALDASVADYITDMKLTSEPEPIKSPTLIPTQHSLFGTAATTATRERLIAVVVNMGFTRAVAQAGLRAVGYRSADEALEWVFTQSQQALDTINANAPADDSSNATTAATTNNTTVATSTTTDKSTTDTKQETFEQRKQRIIHPYKQLFNVTDTTQPPQCINTMLQHCNHIDTTVLQSMRAILPTSLTNRHSAETAHMAQDSAITSTYNAMNDLLTSIDNDHQLLTELQNKGDSKDKKHRTMLYVDELLQLWRESINVTANQYTEESYAKRLATSTLLALRSSTQSTNQTFSLDIIDTILSELSNMLQLTDYKATPPVYALATQHIYKPTETYAAALLYMLDNTLKQQANRTISLDELLPQQIKPMSIKSVEFDEKDLQLYPAAVLDVQHRILDVCIKLLHHAVSTTIAVPSMMNVLAQLTRYYPFTREFIERGGMLQLTRLPNPTELPKVQPDSSKITHHQTTAPLMHSFYASTSCSTLLRHLLYTPSGMLRVMQQDIIQCLNDYTADIKHQIIHHVDEHKKKLPTDIDSLHHAHTSMPLKSFIEVFNAAIRCDAATFIKAVQNTCQIGQAVVKKPDAMKSDTTLPQSDAVSYYIRLLPVEQIKANTDATANTKNTTDTSNAAAAATDAIIDTAMPTTSKPNNRRRKHSNAILKTSTSSITDTPTRNTKRADRRRSKSRQRTDDTKSTDTMVSKASEISDKTHKKVNTVPKSSSKKPTNDPIKREDYYAHLALRIVLDALVCDLQRCMLRIHKHRQQDTDNKDTAMQSNDTLTDNEQPRQTSESEFGTANESDTTTPLKQRKHTSHTSTSRRLIDNKYTTKFPRIPVEWTPVTNPNDTNTHPLLHHTTILNFLSTQLEYDENLLPQLLAYNPSKTVGVTCTFDSLTSMLTHFMVLDPIQQFFNTADSCEFLLKLCAAASIQASVTHKKSETNDALESAHSNKFSLLDTPNKDLTDSTSSLTATPSKHTSQLFAPQPTLPAFDIWRIVMSEVTASMLRILTHGCPQPTTTLQSCHVRLPKHADTILDQIKQHQQQQANIDYAQPATIKQYKMQLVALAGLASMFSSIMSKSHTSLPSSEQHAHRRKIARLLIDCHAVPVLTGTLQYINFHANIGIKVSLGIVNSVINVLELISKLDAIYPLRAIGKYDKQKLTYDIDSSDSDSDGEDTSDMVLYQHEDGRLELVPTDDMMLDSSDDSGEGDTSESGSDSLEIDDMSENADMSIDDGSEGDSDPSDDSDNSDELGSEGESDDNDDSDDDNDDDDESDMESTSEQEHEHEHDYEENEPIEPSDDYADEYDDDQYVADADGVFSEIDDIPADASAAEDQAFQSFHQRQGEIGGLLGWNPPNDAMVRAMAARGRADGIRAAAEAADDDYENIDIDTVDDSLLDVDMRQAALRERYASSRYAGNNTNALHSAAAMRESMIHQIMNSGAASALLDPIATRAIPAGRAPRIQLASRGNALRYPPVSGSIRHDHAESQPHPTVHRISETEHTSAAGRPTFPAVRPLKSTRSPHTSPKQRPKSENKDWPTMSDSDLFMALYQERQDIAHEFTYDIGDRWYDLNNDQTLTQATRTRIHVLISSLLPQHDPVLQLTVERTTTDETNDNENTAGKPTTDKTVEEAKKLEQSATHLQRLIAMMPEAIVRTSAATGSDTVSTTAPTTASTTVSSTSNTDTTMSSPTLAPMTSDAAAANTESTIVDEPDSDLDDDAQFELAMQLSLQSPNVDSDAMATDTNTNTTTAAATTSGAATSTSTTQPNTTGAVTTATSATSAAPATTSATTTSTSASARNAAQSDYLEALDPAVLAELPPYIREEILAQQRIAQRIRARETGALIPEEPAVEPTTSHRTSQGDMDTATFIQTLDPQMRMEFYLHADESVIESLPPDLLAECFNIRSAHTRHTYDDMDEIEYNSSELAMPELNRSNRTDTTSTTNQTTASGTTQQPTLSEPELPKPSISQPYPPFTHHSFTRIDDDKERGTQPVLIDIKLLPPILRVLYISDNIDTDQHIAATRINHFNRLIEHLCVYPITRNVLLQLFVALVSNQKPNSFIQQLQEQLPSQLLGANEADNIHTPTIVVNRILHVLQYLISKKPYIMAAFMLTPPSDIEQVVQSDVPSVVTSTDKLKRGETKYQKLSKTELQQAKKSKQKSSDTSMSQSTNSTTEHVPFIDILDLFNTELLNPLHAHSRDLILSALRMLSSLIELPVKIESELQSWHDRTNNKYRVITISTEQYKQYMKQQNDSDYSRTQASKPKPAMSATEFWQQEYEQQQSKQPKSKRKTKSAPKPPSDMSKYNELAEQDQQRYNTELDQYNQQQTNNKVIIKPIPDVPTLPQSTYAGMFRCIQSDVLTETSMENIVKLLLYTVINSTNYTTMVTEFSTVLNNVCSKLQHDMDQLTQQIKHNVNTTLDGTMWSLTAVEGSVLRYVKILQTLKLDVRESQDAYNDNNETQQNYLIKIPSNLKNTYGLKDTTAQYGRSIMEQSGVYTTLKKLWLSLDKYLTAMERMSVQQHKRSTLTSPAKSVERQISVASQASDDLTMIRTNSTNSTTSNIPRTIDTRHDLDSSTTESQTRESDLLLLLHLPLIEAFFILNTPNNPQTSQANTPRNSNDYNSITWHNFTLQHRRILNVACRHQPNLMRAGSTFVSLLSHSAKILDFDIRRKHFRNELRRLSSQRNRTHATLKLYVRRNTIFEDSYEQLRRISADQLKSRLTVKFLGEEGLDAGGLAREWYLVLSRAVFNPNYALFTASSVNNNIFQPNPNSSQPINVDGTIQHLNPNHIEYFNFIGKFVAKAIYDNQRLDAYFTRSFYKHITKTPIEFSDFETYDFEYYKNLNWILNNSIEDGILDLTFSIENNKFGIVDTIDLIENGRNVAVTDSNKKEYVRLIVQYYLDKSIEKQITAFLNGFYSIIPYNLINLFNENEIELLISGLPNINIVDFQANTLYQGYKSTDNIIQWFWQIVEEMSEQEKALLILFITGTSKIPLGGFAELQGSNGTQLVQIQKVELDANNNDVLPTSHTCFNQLDLPNYHTYDILKDKLLFAIKEGSTGFGFR